MDLSDAALLTALDSLGSLETASEKTTPFVMEPPPPQVQPIQGAAPVVPAVLPAPAWEPHPESGEAGHAIDPVNPLAALAAEGPPRTSAAPTARPASSRRELLAALGSALVVGPLAWWQGRAGRFAGTAASEQIKPIEPGRPGGTKGPAAAEPRSSESSPPALRGRISYLAVDGESRPDAGARILAFPEMRAGTSLISANGFRPGASQADADLARESLRLLGGGFTVADAEGRYQLGLASSGEYRLLIISRYQARDHRVALSGDMEQVLTRFFEQPAQIIGDMQYDFSRYRNLGREPSLRDHVFERG